MRTPASTPPRGLLPGLPCPKLARTLRHEVDFLWREQRLVVEADTFLYHRGAVAFEDDYTRDLDLRTAGFTILRFADTQLEEEPDRIAAALALAV
jgi:very-short-patch-repair endonuclease